MALGLVGTGASACASEAAKAPAPTHADKCVVFLHGKGSTGSAAVQRNGYALVAPTGNADGWGARQWLYFPDDRYTEAVGVVRSAIDSLGCTDVVVHGFSNGAAFAAAMYCHGESFDGRLRGVIVDDPVPDHGTESCAPAAGVQVAVYWTGGLDGQAEPGASCQPIDWTCQGGSLVGIDAYATPLGAPVLRSPNRTHTPMDEPPEVRAWLGLSAAG
jgi:hypothetical protein